MVPRQAISGPAAGRHGRRISQPAADTTAFFALCRRIAKRGSSLWLDTPRGSKLRAGCALARSACAAAALAGCGVAAVPLWLVRREVDAGSLELVLPEFEPSPLQVHAVWPTSRGLAARGRAFLDVLSARLAAERLTAERLTAERL